mgnify:CR=1 FL=1
MRERRSTFRDERHGCRGGGGWPRVPPCRTWCRTTRRLLPLPARGRGEETTLQRRHRLRHLGLAAGSAAVHQSWASSTTTRIWKPGYGRGGWIWGLGVAGSSSSCSSAASTPRSNAVAGGRGHQLSSGSGEEGWGRSSPRLHALDLV